MSASKSLPKGAEDSIGKILRENNRDVFAAAKQAIMEKVLLAAVQEALDDLGSPEAIAERALSYVDDEHKSLRKGREILTSQLLDDIALRSSEALSDADKAANEAKARLGEIPDVVVAGTDALTNNLVQEIADRSIETLADAEESAKQAHERLQDHQSILEAVDTLRERLVEEIANRSADSIADTKKVVGEAREQIGEEHKSILQAVDTLREQILQTIVSHSLSRITDEVGGGDLAALFAPQAFLTEPEEEDEESEPETPPPAQRTRKKAANGYEEDVRFDALEETSSLLDDLINGPTNAAGYYVYGIVANDPSLTDAMLPDTGIDGTQAPYLVQYESVAAIVSACTSDTVGLPADASDEAKETHKRQLETIFERVAAAGHTILPMQNGTMYTSEADLLSHLATSHDALEEALITVTGCREWSVRIYCDQVKVWKTVQEDQTEAESYAAYVGEMIDKLSEEDQSLDRDAEIQAFKEGMDVEIETLIDTIFNHTKARTHAALEEIAAESMLIPSSGDPVFGNGVMILGASYLVNVDQGEQFRAVLEQMAAEHKKLGFSYYIGGPHHAYQFASQKAPTL